MNHLDGFFALAALLRRFDGKRGYGERLAAAIRAVPRIGPWTYDLAPQGVPAVPTYSVADAVLTAYEIGPARTATDAEPTVSADEGPVALVDGHRPAGRLGGPGRSVGHQTGAAMTPTGTGRPYLGTNALAFAIPVAGEALLVLDMATSAVSGGKFEIALRKRSDVPFGCGLDERGHPTRDPGRVYPGAVPCCR